MIKKSEERKLKSLEPKFYVEALGSENFSVGDYGLDRKRLGRALGRILRKNGTSFNTSDRYCFMLTNHLEDEGLIKATVDRFVVVENWREILQRMFPKEELEAKQVEVSIANTAEEQPTQEEISGSAESTEKTVTIAIGSLKNVYEFYEVLLERIGGDFKTQVELRNLVFELYKENFGETPDIKFFYNRTQFLTKSGLLESIEDEGVVKYLRSENYKETLDSRKTYLSRRPYEIKTTPAVVEMTVESAEEKKEETPKKEEERPVVSQTKEKESTVCVCINPMDLTKLYETEVLFDDGHRCVILLETIPANLDVLKNIEAEVDPKGQSQLWEKLAEQREYYLAELAKIERLCGKKA